MTLNEVKFFNSPLSYEIKFQHKSHTNLDEIVPYKIKCPSSSASPVYWNPFEPAAVWKTGQSTTPKQESLTNAHALINIMPAALAQAPGKTAFLSVCQMWENMHVCFYRMLRDTVSEEYLDFVYNLLKDKAVVLSENGTGIP